MTEHVVRNNRWPRVAGKAGLLVELFGEQIDAEITMLASLSESSDMNDLAGTALQDHDITDVNEVAW